MERKQLRKSLEALQKELRNVRSIDEISKERITCLMRDIQKILDQPEDVVSDHHRNLLENLQGTIEHFETSHPTLTKVMSEVINLLKNLGI